jgi:hypothetical protein
MDLIEDINDATNITGMSKLLNKSNTDAGLNAELIERDMISKAGSKLTKNVNPDKEYMEAMKELADISGVPLGDMNVGSSVDDGSLTGSSEGEWESDDEWETGEDSDEHSSSDENDEKFIKRLKNTEVTNSKNVLKAPKIDLGKRDKNSGHNVFTRTPVADPNPMRSSPAPFAPQQMPMGPQSMAPMPRGGGYGQQNMMRQQNDQFNQAMQGYGNNATGNIIDIDRENEEENKTLMLEDIDELMAELQDDEVDLSRIPKVNQDSPIEDVAQVQKILRMKYDRRRYTTFGTEFILAAVHGLEYLFDGKRKWGPYQPDLTNWHNTVRTKLRRMRYETSMIVSNVMTEWNVGAFTRIMIELVPSAFLHSRMRSEQHGKAGYSPDQMSEAYDALRAYDKE